MDVKFNSTLGFGAKRVPYTKLVGDYRKAHAVIHPLHEAPNLVKGLDHNIEAVHSVPRKVLDSVIKKLKGRGLFVKPEETEAKSVLIDLVCDLTDKGEEARKVFNSTAMNSYKTKVKAKNAKSKVYA